MKKRSKEFLQRLMATISPSGYEDEAALVWGAEAEQFAATVTRDTHGNTHAVVNPGGSPRVMFAGHYDEIGFLVSHVDDDGYLWIAPIGGWDAQIPQGHHVVIRGKSGHIPGVIGKCPVHLLKEDNRKKVTAVAELWVDIGAKNRKDALKHVAVGDPLVMAYGYRALQGDRVVSRGFDDKAGAFTVLEAARLLSRMKPSAEIHAVATVQEEIGLRGARTAAYGIDPAVGIAVDVTFATDQPGLGDAVKREGKIRIGKGPVVTRGPNINHKLFDLLVAAADKDAIPYQVTAEPRGTGTDANAIQLNRAGVATALVSIPNRYMHSPCELVSLGDLDHTAALLAAVTVQITPETSFVPF